MRCRTCHIHNGVKQSRDKTPTRQKASETAVGCQGQLLVNNASRQTQRNPTQTQRRSRDNPFRECFGRAGLRSHAGGAKTLMPIQKDYDCFYAAVFENEQPALKSLPLAVQQKQIIVTCNYEARKRVNKFAVLGLCIDYLRELISSGLAQIAAHHRSEETLPRGCDCAWGRSDALS